MSKYIVLQENEECYLVYPYQNIDEPTFHPHIQNDYLFLLSKKEIEDGNLIRYQKLPSWIIISNFDLETYTKKPEFNYIKQETTCLGHYTVNPDDLVFCLDYKELNKEIMDRYNKLL